MTIQVKQEHIDKGIRGDCGACPIALAIQDALPDRRTVSATISVHGGFVYIDTGYAALPAEACFFINSFDHATDLKWLEPFEFELDYWPEEKE